MSILLPHYDDELFILPFIDQKVKEGFKIFLYFFSTDLDPSREEESLKMLANYSSVEVVSFGIRHNIIDGKVFEKKHFIIDELRRNVHIASSDLLVTPMFEGGHYDHDEIFKVGHSLATELKIPQLCFSIYNGYDTSFVRVARIIQGPAQGLVETLRFSLSDGLSYLAKCFYFKSQWKILSVLFPGMVRLFIFRRRIELLVVTSFDQTLPHPGPLFYENQLKAKVKKILRLKT